MVFLFCTGSPSLKMMPTFMLKRIVLQSFPTHVMERDIADSVDFMVERVSAKWCLLWRCLW